MKPTPGRIVLYKSKIDNGEGNDVVSPAIVLRTRDSTVLEVVQRWSGVELLTAPDGSMHQTGNRPDSFVEVLPDDYTIDLLVFGLGRDYREYCVSHGYHRGQWDWPPREPKFEPIP